jgi:hypothetical protein
MRARNIKPGFFKNEDLAECDPMARILFAGLWCIADRKGRLEYRPKRIKADIFPYDDCDVEKLINQLSKKDFIMVYKIESQIYIQINKFDKHQNCHIKEAASTIPAPDKHSTSMEVAQPITESLLLNPESFNPESGAVDNSAPKPETKPEIKSEPVPEPPKEKNAFFEKRNKEFSEVMAKIKAKYNYKEQQEIENWIKANYRGKHPDALIHTLNAIIKYTPDKISLYLDKVLVMENQNYNVADYDKQAAEFKKPGMFSMAELLAGMRQFAVPP